MTAQVGVTVGKIPSSDLVWKDAPCFSGPDLQGRHTVVVFSLKQLREGMGQSPSHLPIRWYCINPDSMRVCVVQNLDQGVDFYNMGGGTL